MRTFLGVDQSLRGTGVVVLNEAGDLLLQRLVQPAGLRGAARLGYIRGALAAVIAEHQPTEAAFEGYSFDSVNRAFALGELGGIVQLAFFDADLPFRQIPPKTLKKFVANNGAADKAKMIEKTEEKWGVAFGEEDDLCDAYGLARLVRALAVGDSQHRHELEVIKMLLAGPKKTPAALKTTRGKVKISL